jgi:nuclear cap-binding protein subunit 1
LLTGDSIVEQPFKIPFIAAVAFYGNEVKPEITIEAMKRVGDRAQEALNAGEWKEFKLLLRFFACLQWLYEDDGVFTFLAQLFDTVVDLQSANDNDVRYFDDIANVCTNIVRSLVLSLSRLSFSLSPMLLLPEEVASTNKHNNY